MNNDTLKILNIDTKASIYSSQKTDTITLSCIIFVCFICSLLIINNSRYNSNQTLQIAENQFNTQQQMLAQSTAAAIQIYIDKIIESITLLSNVHHPLNNITCHEKMHTEFNRFPAKTSIRYLNAQGCLQYVYPYTTWRRTLIGEKYAKASYFIEAIKFNNLIASQWLLNEKNEPRIRFAVPIYQKIKSVTTRLRPLKTSTSDLKGVLIVSISPEEVLHKIASPIKSGESGYAFVINHKSEFLYHYHPHFIGRESIAIRKQKNPDFSYTALEQIQNKMLNGETGTGHYTSGWHRGQSGIIQKSVAFAPISVGNTYWSVAVCAPTSEISKLVKKIQHNEKMQLIYYFIVLALSALAIIILFHRRAHLIKLVIRQNENQLQAAQNYFHQILNNTHSLIIIFERNGKILFVNTIAEQISGWSKEELLGQNIHTLILENSPDLQPVWKHENFQPIAQKNYLLDKKGHPHIIHSITSHFEGASFHKNDIFLLQGVDQTEIHELNNSLAVTELLINKIMQTAPIGIVVMFQDTIKMTNQFACQLTGLPSRTLLESDGRIFFDSEDKYQRITQLNRNNNHEKIIVLDSKVKRDDRRDIDVQISATPICNGPVKGIIFVIADTSEKKEAYRQMAESEAKYRDLIERANDGIVIAQNGRIEFCNPQICTMLGYSATELLDKPFVNFVCKTERKKVTHNYESRIKGRRVDATYDTRLLCKNKTIKEVEFNAGLIQYQNKPASFVFIRDVTEKKAADNQLMRSEQKLRKLASHLQIIREEERKAMALAIHDELGQDFTALKMDVAWLERRLRPNTAAIDNKFNEMHDLITKSINKMHNLIAELRPGILDDLGLMAAVEWQAGEFEKRTNIQCQLTLLPTDLKMDQNFNISIFRIIQEALNNVARHAKAQTVILSFTHKEDYLKLTIQDDGIGITKEQLNAPDSFGLIGIKERLVPWRGILKIHGRPQQGTTLTITLPNLKKKVSDD